MLMMETHWPVDKSMKYMLKGLTDHTAATLLWRTSSQLKFGRFCLNEEMYLSTVTGFPLKVM